jgi:transcriptional regulator with XRE-family HTH domain
MNDLGGRIMQLRKEKGLSQTDLANQVGVSYAQIGRYETKGTQPSADILKKLADALNTTSDYLMNGNKDDKAVATLNDNELLKQFKEVDKMSPEDQDIIKKLIDAFITKAKIKQLIL